MKITDKIKTLADVGQTLNIDLEAIATVFRQLPVSEDEQNYLVDHYNWIKIAEALNEGKVPSFKNEDRKYYAYAWVKPDALDPSGFALTGTGTAWSCTSTTVGARLLFAEEKLARYAITQFPDIYKRAFVQSREVAA